MSEITEGKIGSLLIEVLARDDFEEGKCWRRHGYQNGEVILREGGCSGKVFLVLEGTLRILGSAAMGSHYVVRPGVRDVGKGAVFGEFSLLDRAPHSTTVVAVSDCALAEIENDALLDLLARDRELGYLVYRALALELVDRLRTTDKQLFAMLAWGLKAHGYDKYMNPTPGL